MKIKTMFCYLGLMVFMLVSGLAFAQKINSNKNVLDFQKMSDKPMATLVNINNITLWVGSDGKLVPKPYPSNYDPTRICWWSAIFPKGMAGCVFHDGIIWGGLVNDGKLIQFDHQDYLVRVGGSDYRSGLQPGCIISKGLAEEPESNNVRIWRIRRDWKTADLSDDAAEIFHISKDSLKQQQINAVRLQYEKDWKEWPWNKGAPFYDNNGNGLMDAGEEPGIAYADQVVWYVANDLDSIKAVSFWGSPPIGLEMQVTLWVYNRSEYQSNDILSNINRALQDVVFKRVRILYKGCNYTPDTAFINSMYIGQWSDLDLGKWFDDLVGCDTLLNIGYVYNGSGTDTEYKLFDLKPPSVGYSLVYGPVIPSQGEQALFSFKVKNDYKNLSMTSFSWHRSHVDWTPCGHTGDYSYRNGTLPWYNCLKGYQRSASSRLLYYPFPYGIKANKFPLSGDPITKTGHIDGFGTNYSFPPGDRQITCSSGPFTMALGDTQEVIIALVGGIGADRLSSISVMKHNTRWIRSWMPYIFEMGFPEEKPPETEKAPIPASFRLFQNYPNPFNAETEIRYDLPIQRNVKLTIYNLLGEEVKVLSKKNQLAGSYSVKWDGKDSFGNKVPTGVYLYCLEADHWKLTKKMMLLQ